MEPARPGVVQNRRASAPMNQMNSMSMVDRGDEVADFVSDWLRDHLPVGRAVRTHTSVLVDLLVADAALANITCAELQRHVGDLTGLIEAELHARRP